MNTQELIDSLKLLRGNYIGDGVHQTILVADVVKQLEEYQQFKTFIKAIVKE
jgi:hypothetical protein